MSFDALLGNGQTKENLGLALKKGRISHFYLISGPEGSGKHTLARLLAAAIIPAMPLEGISPRSWYIPARIVLVEPTGSLRT